MDQDLSLSACRLFCTDNLTLWPKPTGQIHYGKTLRHLNTNSIDVLTPKPDSPAGKLVRDSAQVTVMLYCHLSGRLTKFFIMNGRRMTKFSFFRDLKQISMQSPIRPRKNLEENL